MSDFKDEHDGLGGSYLLDPSTGIRVLIERTEDLVLTAAPEATIAPVAEAEQAIPVPEAEQALPGQSISETEE